MRLQIVQICVICAFAGALVSVADGSKDAALNAAKSWLALVDSGKYAESWDESAQVLKKQIARDDWIKKLNSLRSQLGKVESRVLNSCVSFTKPLPNAAESEFMTVRYDTNFEAAKSSSETVTLAEEKDDQWRVSGYFIDRQ